MAGDLNRGISEPIVKITAPDVTGYAGKSSRIILDVEVKEGYHIQANKVNDEFLVPTTVEVVTGKNIELGKQSFPVAKKFKLEGTNDFLDVYDGNFQITIPFKTQRGVKKGKYNLQARLRYQACDFKSCLFPKTIEFIIPLTLM
jgi:DsbC/DsbD-like thiol-disulfide interchange protein